MNIVRVTLHRAKLHPGVKCYSKQRASKLWHPTWSTNEATSTGSRIIP